MQWLVENRDFLVALAALLVAGGEAIYAISHFSRLNARLAESTTVLASVKNLLNTRPIGEFPDFIKVVAQLISEAREEVRIVCAFPAFGCFSKYETFLLYKQAIERKASITSLVCLDEARRVIRHQRQFPDGLRRPPSHVRDFQKKLRELEERERCQVNDDKVFQDVLFKQDDRMLADLKLKEFRVSDQDFPLHMWIIDHNRAVFSFPRFTDQDKEIAFETDHHDLVMSLQHAWAMYASTSKEVRDTALRSLSAVEPGAERATGETAAS